MRLRAPTTTRARKPLRQALPRMLLALTLAALGTSAAAKDFPEAAASVDPLAPRESEGLPAALGASLEYADYALSHDDVDSFYLRSSLSPVFFDSGGVFALGSLYESVLMCGPVAASETAANAADFWMNAVQFEYGICAAASMPGLPGLHLLAEYSRRSQHPLRSQYSQVAADVVMVGTSLRDLELGPVRLQSYLRLGYHEIFAFWHSTLPQPRESWVLRPGLEASWALGSRLVALGRIYPQLFLDRYSGLVDANWFAEAGLGLRRGELDDELLLTFYQSDDDELLATGPHRALELGFAFRLSACRL